jgi:hypothetical protein
VGDEVESVLDTTCSFEGGRIYGYTQRLWQLLEVEGLCLPGELDCSLEKSAVHVVTDHPVSEVMESPLRERRGIFAKTVKNHLPSKVYDGQLDGFGIRDHCIRLQQCRHGHHRWRQWGLCCTCAPVHRFELSLEIVVEQVEAMVSKKSEQPPMTT